MQNEEEQTITSGMGLSGINGSTDLVGNDGQKVDVKIGKTIQEVIEEERSIKIINPYADLSPLSMYNPLAPKKRNTNRTPPKKKRKKK